MVVSLSHSAPEKALADLNQKALSELRVLGIETSCDETAVAVVSGDRRILSNQILSQFDAHQAYGGVVPEIAARAHSDHLDTLIRAALSEASTDLTSIDALAVTAGPGLIGGVMVGVLTAKAIALSTAKPIFPVNHLEGHALSPRLISEIPFPYLLLLISGGHCQLLVVKGVGNYQRLGTTIDDAAGEAFDKTAKLLGLGVPGGPAVEQWASRGDAQRFQLPKPLANRADCDFSFSGLKTAVRRVAEELHLKAALDDQAKADLCASLQQTIGRSLVERSKRAMQLFRDSYPEINAPAFVVAGGVAANRAIGDALRHLSADEGFSYTSPPPSLCTDNGVMIAWAGIEHIRAGITPVFEFAARPRWPLDEAADAAIGGGKKGAKV